MNVFLSVGSDDATKLEKIKFGNILLRELQRRNEKVKTAIKEYFEYYEFFKDLESDPVKQKKY